MSTATPVRTTPPPRTAPLPFTDGMRLTRDEFRRLGELHPEIKHVERIDGVVVMPAAIRYKHHSKPHQRVEVWLGMYEVSTPGVDSTLCCTVSIDPDNDPEPDSMLIVLPAAGGRCTISPDDYLEGAPELIVEISGSTMQFDLGRKRQIYESNGVDEYIVWLTELSEIRWFRLRSGRYEPLTPDERGIVRSETFPGLWLDVPAMLRLDMKQVLAVLNEGLAFPEHAAFVERLRVRMGSPPEA